MNQRHTWVLCTLLWVAAHGHARELSALRLDPPEVSQGGEVTLTLELPKGVACGALIDFGDGTTADLKIEADAPGKTAHVYQQPGAYTVTVKGKTIWRGLKTTRFCDGQLQSVVRVDSAAAGPMPTSKAVAQPSVGITPVAKPSGGGQRVALVIGNDAYTVFRPLRNAVQDARDVALELRAAGFDVPAKWVVTNGTRHQMDAAVQDFVSRIGPADEVVFYYSGHGVEIDSQAALIPVDLTDPAYRPLDKSLRPPSELTQAKQQVLHQSITLNQVAFDIAAKNVKFSLLIVDACRDNPVLDLLKTAHAANNLARSAAGSAPMAGLIVDSNADSQVLLFSASKGQQSLDRLNDADPVKNGVFTRVLLKAMRTPGLGLRDMLPKIKNEVQALAATVKSNGQPHQQQPRSMATYEAPDFYFRPPSIPVVSVPASTATSVPVASLAPEAARESARQPTAALTTATATPESPASNAQDRLDEEAWALTKRINTAEAYRSYLARAAKGKYADIATDALKLLEQQTARAREDQAWDSIKSSNDMRDAMRYLAAYPNGEYRTQAMAKTNGITKLGNGCVVAGSINSTDTVVTWSGTCEKGLITGSGILTIATSGTQGWTAKWTGKYESGVRVGQFEVEQNYVSPREGSNRVVQATLWFDPSKGVLSRQILVLENGVRYEGETDANKGKVFGSFEGLGKLSYPGNSSGSGSYKYDGAWANGKRHGRGTLTNAANEKFVGEWVDHELHGFARVYGTNGDLVYEGQFAAGKRTGMPCQLPGGRQQLVNSTAECQSLSQRENQRLQDMANANARAEESRRRAQAEAESEKAAQQPSWISSGNRSQQLTAPQVPPSNGPYHYKPGDPNPCQYTGSVPTGYVNGSIICEFKR